MSSTSLSDREKGGVDSVTSHNVEPLSNTDVDEAKLLRKIDLRVLPFICVMYVMAFLDRVNISNAALFSLSKDLKLKSRQFDTALMIFFISYMVFELPSNILLKRLKPHVWLSICMFGFGIVTMSQGFTKGYGGILTTRFLLGAFEAGMFPGCFYLLSMWYRREESQKRLTFFFCSTTLAGAFGGLLASAIGKMDGLHGFHGWRWIFILEGLLTAVLACVLYFFLPDFPEDAKFLTDTERAYVRQRLRDDVGSSGHDSPMTVKAVLAVFKDYKIFLGGFMYCGLILPAYGYAYFAPTIIKGLGYGVIETQLRSVPPWVASFGFSMTAAYFSDRLRHRYLFAIGTAMVGLAGFATLLAYPASIHVRYGALFLAACGTYASMPIVIGWFGCNLGGHLRRSTGIAWQMTFGNISGIIAVYGFPAEDGPRYHKGYALCVAFLCLSITASTAYFAAVTVENARRDRLGVIDKTEEKEELGDLNPSHRYLR